MLKFFKFNAFILRAMWKHLNGRWYYFRDEPDWAVEKLAAREYKTSTSKEIVDMIDYARREVKSRAEIAKRPTL